MSRPHLSNSPLNEVVCELRFPGRFTVLANLEKFQRAVLDEFPHLLVPNINPGEAPAAKPYRLTSADGAELISIGLTTFAFISRNYTVFAEYKERLDYLLSLFREIYWPDEFSRLGLRYINSLPPSEIATLAEFHPWLVLSLDVPNLKGNKSTAGQGYFVVNNERLNLRVSFDYDLAKTQSEGTFLLDFDCFRQGPIPSDEFEAFLTEGHNLIDQTFFSLLSKRGLNESTGSVGEGGG